MAASSTLHPSVAAEASTEHLVRRWLDDALSALGQDGAEAPVRARAVDDLEAILAHRAAELACTDAATSAALVVCLVEAAARRGWVPATSAALGTHVLRMLGVRSTTPIGTPIGQLSTPCLVLDRDRLDANLERMRGRAQALDVRLRPHIKTTKSIDIARRAVGPGGPLTVSTLREAEHFARHGFTDLTYAVAIVPDRLDRVARLSASGVRVGLFVECPAVAAALAAHPGCFEAWIEVDCGEDRTGVRSTEAVVAIGRILQQAPRCRLRGVATHGGHSYAARSTEAVVAIAEQERVAAVRAAQALRSVGIPCPEVSVGSTPTAVHAVHLEGVTEFRPGVYTLGDLFQAGIDSLSVDDIACSVLTTVLSHRPRSGRVVIDAGGLALSKDRSTAGRAFDAGYGRLAHAESGALIDGLMVASVHQEHGEVVAQEAVSAEQLPVGSRLRVLPNHICMTAAQYDCYHVIADGHVVAVWPRVNGW